MTDATPATGKPKARRPSAPLAPPSELPKVDPSQFEPPSIEVPTAFRKIAEQGVAQAEDACEKAKAAAAEATNAIEETYTIAAQGTAEYNRKVVEAICSNTDIFFHFVRALLNVKSPAEFLKLSVAHVTQQLEAMAEQTKELAALAQKIANATAEPIKKGVNSVVKKVDQRPLDA